MGRGEEGGQAVSVPGQYISGHVAKLWPENVFILSECYSVGKQVKSGATNS